MNLPGSRFAVLFAALSALTVPEGVRAQASPLVLELHGGASVPAASFRSGSRPGEGVDPGRSLGVALIMSGEGRRAFYAGFSQHRFACAVGGCGSDEVYVSTAFDVGMRVDLLTRRAVVPWVRLGATTGQVEVPDAMAVNGRVSKVGFGGELGLGLYIGVSSPVALVPGIRVTAVNTELPGGELLRMRYVVADVALALAF